MFKQLLLPLMIVASLFFTQSAVAGDECKSDADCKDGKLCILALKPPVCKPPQPAGSTCKRDVVCQSKKCDIPAGKETGICK